MCIELVAQHELDEVEVPYYSSAPMKLNSFERSSQNELGEVKFETFFSIYLKPRQN